MGTGAQRNYRISILGDFQDLTGQSPEQPHLNAGLTLLWAGCWTGDLLMFLPVGRVCSSIVCGTHMLQTPQETLVLLE